MRYIQLYISFCILACFMGLAISGCSSPVKIQAFNQADSNLNNRGDNVPVTLIIYQLKDISKFKQSSIQDLSTRGNVVLGRDIVDFIKVQVPPNEIDVPVAEFAKKEGKYIGVLALFANPQDKKQKFYKKLNRVFSNKIELNIATEGIMQHKKSKQSQGKDTKADGTVGENNIKDLFNE